MSYRPNVSIKFSDSAAISPFNRARVANPETIFDSKQTNDERPFFWDTSTANGGSSTHIPNESASRLAVTSTAGSQAIRQTKRRFNYEPGKGHLIIHTFNLSGNDSGICKRIGYFDSNNGIFLEANGTDIRIVQRTSTSGSPSDAVFAAQSNWNIDAFDGSGGASNPSGVNIDFTKTQILIIDFQWLGVGRVRVGFDIGGVIYYAHEFLNANSVSTVFMRTPNLPLRVEIVNISSGSGSSLDQICSTVISEGGTNTIGIIRSANNGITSPVDIDPAGTAAALIGIRLKATHLDVSVQLVKLSILALVSADYLWQIHLNPTVGGTFSYSDVTDSAVQIALAETANDPTTNVISSPGTILDSGYGANILDGADASLETALTLGSTIGGTPDEIVLSAAAATANIDFVGSLTWRELL